MSDKLLEIKNLEAGYQTKMGRVLAVNDVSFELKKGELIGIAGESGCGKSTLAYSIMNLLEDNGAIFSGEINFSGDNLVDFSAKEIKQFRWQKMSMVFQSAMNALNPVMKISEQLIDALKAHQKGISEKEARKRAEEMLELVDIQKDRLDAYPHQLSGGMKQRVMIAMAMILNPDLVIMDEPTTALDVVVQRNIIEKIEDLRSEFNFSIIFITHDLSLLVEISDKLAIMYAGKILEIGPAAKIYSNPLHPYTKGLMNSFPPLTGEIEEMSGIEGKPPDLLNPPAGCPFYPRCEKRMEICKTEMPEFKELENEHQVKCYLYQGSDNLE
jgi:peptide/nickel transport system ATP-binding protein